VKKEPPFAKQAIQAWWQEASEMGEKAYVEKQILRPKRILRQNPKNEAEVVLGEKLLLIQKTRYPEQLPDTYRRLLKTKTPSNPVAKALSEPAALPQELKIALLDEGIATGKPEHRNSALLVLGGLDQAAAEVRLLKLLNDSPATAEGTYMMDQNANLGHFVATSRDPKTWDAFHNLLTRADLGMKMELIANCPPKRDAPPEVLASFYQIYERFGRDETLRDKSSSEKFKGARAVFPHDRITMGNFVHMMFANWLEFPLKEPEGENEEEWAAYRAKVKQRLDESRKPRPPEAK
jgi:hypothetical protein